MDIEICNMIIYILRAYLLKSIIKIKVKTQMAQRNKRIQRQLQSIKKDPVPGCVVQQVIGIEFTWSLCIQGPYGTPYAGGYFFIHATFPNDYPFHPPKCIFQTKIYHPNVHSDGKFCMQILMNQWSPALTLSKIILNIQEFLINPNNEHCCCIPEIGEELVKDRAKFEEKAKQWTLKYAT